MACRHCNFQNSIEDLYCLQCGQKARDMSPSEVKEKNEAQKELYIRMYREAITDWKKSVGEENVKKKTALIREVLRKSELALYQGGAYLGVNEAGKLETVRIEAKKELNRLNDYFQSVGNGREVELSGSSHAFYVDVLINQTEMVRLHLDTGASTILLPRHVFEKLNIRSHEDTFMTVADGRRVPGKLFTLDSVNVQGVVAKNVMAMTSDAAVGLLGMSYLNQFSFEIRTADKKLILKPKS